MQSKLRELTELLLGQEALSYGIYSDSDRINQAVDKYNNLLELKSVNADGLKSKHISETVIVPLAFHGFLKNDKFDLVCFKLSGDYNKANIHIEKQKAGESWKDYFYHYTSTRYFDYKKDEHSSYYTNIAKMMYAFYHPHNEGDIKIEDIQKDLSVEKEDILLHLLNEKNVLFPNIVPFHGEAFETNIHGINHLRENIKAYDIYLDELLKYVDEVLSEDGIIMTNNFADSKVLQQLLLDQEAQVLVENQLLSVLNWKGRLAILFNDQPFTRFGLRSDLEIDCVIGHIKAMQVDQASGENLDAYCKDIILKREASDFKSRGERIKGKSLKRVSVSNLRKK